MNQYEQLLEHLLVHDSTKIPASVSQAAIRKGLKKAITKRNDVSSLLDIPPISKSIVIKETDDTMTISLVEKGSISSNFKPKFIFEPIGDSNGEEKQ